MKIFIVTHILLLLTGAVSSFAQQEAPLSQVQVQGKQFVTAEGQPLVFRGLNSSDPDKLEKSGHWSRSYFKEMKK